MSRTGALEGLTGPINQRVHVRVGGAIEVRRAFGENGAVEAGRPLDYSDFTDPAAGTK
jgi:hypothetical protein